MILVVLAIGAVACEVWLRRLNLQNRRRRLVRH
jgi:hypothetical protein